MREGTVSDEVAELESDADPLGRVRRESPRVRSMAAHRATRRVKRQRVARTESGAIHLVKLMEVRLGLVMGFRLISASLRIHCEWQGCRDGWGLEPARNR